jgi:hypothetical protein
VFILNSSILYGNAFVTFKIHNLIQVSDDIMRFGSIYSFSAYPFENILGIIKRLLRKSEHPLQQMLSYSYRTIGLVEKTSNALKLPHEGGILLPHRNRRTPHYRLLQLSKFDLTLECGDSCI